MQAFLDQALEVLRAGFTQINDPKGLLIALAAITRIVAALVLGAVAYAVESASVIARETVQMHGGNGFTWEYNVHRYLKLASTLEQHYGRQDDVIERALVAVEATL